jgi:transcriptional regulator with XRE-family HTH domain
MPDKGSRLKRARQAAGFASARAAAEALHIAVSTYIQHENGTRGFPDTRAPLYARRFKVSEQWLLYGKGEEPQPSLLTEEVLAEMVALALRELPAGTSLAEFPQFLAPSLREQLERFQADASDDRRFDEESAPGTDAQSHAATKAAGRA